jgi:hypothetical protein
LHTRAANQAQDGAKNAKNTIFIALWAIKWRPDAASLGIPQLGQIFVKIWLNALFIEKLTDFPLSSGTFSDVFRIRTTFRKPTKLLQKSLLRLQRIAPPQS